jgi:hypothetical protein
MRTNVAGALVLLGILLAGLAPGHAQAPAPPALNARLRQLVQASGIADLSGVRIDVETGRPVFQHHAERPLNPARTRSCHRVRRATAARA